MKICQWAVAIIFVALQLFTAIMVWAQAPTSIQQEPDTPPAALQQEPPVLSPDAPPQIPEDPSDSHSHLMDDDVMVALLRESTDTLEYHLKIIEVGAIVVVGLLGLAGTLGVWRQTINTKDVAETLRREREERTVWQVAAETRVSSLIDTQVEARVSAAVDERLETIIAKRYDKRVMDMVSTYSQETMMAAPEIRGMLLTRLRQLSHEIGSVLQQCCGEEVAESFRRALQDAMQDWYVMGQLFSTDIKELEKGLLHLKVNRFPGAEQRLEFLRDRWRDDPRLIPLIDRVLGFIKDCDLDVDDR